MRRSLYIRTNTTRHCAIACKNIFKINTCSDRYSRAILSNVNSGIECPILELELESGVRQWQSSFLGISQHRKTKSSENKYTYTRKHTDTMKENEKDEN